MMKTIPRILNVTLTVALSGAMVLFAEPLPQAAQDTTQTRPAQVVDEHKVQQAAPNSDKDNSGNASVRNELPDAPAPAQPVQQSQQDSSQQQNPASVPSGAAGAKAPTVRGTPASRPIGAAIAPTKQKQRRSLLIKTGLVAGACVAVGTVFALSKGSPSKPPGAP